MSRVTRSLLVLSSLLAASIGALVPAPAAVASIINVGTLAGPSLAAMYPSGGEFDAVNGRIVVADTGLNRILFYGLGGRRLGGFGHYSPNVNDPYGFDTPRDVAIDEVGNIYVAVAAQNAIKSYTEAGTYRWTFTTYGANKRVQTPIGLSWDEANDRLLIASTGNGDVIQLNAQGVVQGFDNVLQAIRDVDRGPDGLLYVADYKNHRIKGYDDSGPSWTLQVNVGGPGDGDLNFPYNVDWSPNGNVMYVSDTGHNVVKAYDGTSWWTIGERCPLDTDCDTPDARMDGVRRVAVTPAGEILVFDFWGSGINGFAANGSVTRQIAGETPPVRGFAHASGVDVVKIGGATRIYAVDRLNQTVEWYTPAGDVRAFAGDRGTQPSSVSWPEAVAVTADGVYLGDTRNDRVVVWDLALENVIGMIGAHTSTEFSEVSDLEVLGGTVYIADRRHDRIATATVGGPVSTCVSWPSPEGVAVASNGAIYVTGPTGIARFAGCGGGPTRSRDLDVIGVDVRRSDGSVFVTTPSRVLRLSANLETVRRDTWSGGLFSPHTLSVSGRRIYVADTYNHRVRIFRLG